MKKGLSVIVCCYNSKNRISPTLTHLFKQIVTKQINWEILVIDNRSTDETSEIVKRIAEENCSNNIPIRLIKEHDPGLTSARNRGIKESSYDYLIFCDDDNWLHPNYVDKVFMIFETNKDVAAIGGRGEPVFETECPEWFNEFSSSYAVGPQGKLSGFANKSIYGAGMGLRKSAYIFLLKNGFRPLVTDRIGNKLISGGDTELTMILLHAGFKIYYDENLVFSHFIPTTRLDFQYLLSRNEAKGLTIPIFRDYKKIKEKNLSVFSTSKYYYLFVGFYRKLLAYTYRFRAKTKRNQILQVILKSSSDAYIKGGSNFQEKLDIIRSNLLINITR